MTWRARVPSLIADAVASPGARPRGLSRPLLAVCTASAANTVTYQDSTGEPGVKDITTVVVSNDDKGMITFRVNIPSLPQYTVDVDVDIYVDTGQQRRRRARPTSAESTT